MAEHNKKRNEGVIEDIEDLDSEKIEKPRKSDFVKKSDFENDLIKTENDFVKAAKKNPWIIASIVLGVIVIIMLFFVFANRGISSASMGKNAVNFINTQLLQGQGTVTLDSVTKQGGLYLVTVNYNNQKVPTYFTKDGKYFVGSQIIPTAVIDKDNIPTVSAEIPKSDKPKVELFVMTYCPYGTQAEKGLLPVMDLLKNKADIKIRFVHYFMHGDKEESETYNQVCIRELAPAKFNSYLACFLNASDSAGCAKSTGVSGVIVECASTQKAKDYYKIDSDLSNGYGVQGSPTLIINGVQADFYPRSPASALKLICSAFNNQPSECSQVLSSDNPSAGFGYATGNAADSGAATCG
jgi:protein-disulfide isomerase